jgi:peptidoglycan/LPS O-acetylase OafA/YrhL
MQWENARTFLQQRFTRVTSSVAYIPQLDGLRSLALLLVIGHHVSALYLIETHRLGTQKLPQDWDLIATRSSLVNWMLHLAFGVPFFFAISGFVLAMPFARTVLDGSRLPSIRLYFLRRLIRLEPPYFVFMTFMFVTIVAPWRNSPGDVWVLEHVFGPHYLASIAYLHALIYMTPSWIAGVAWTLEIEIQFYLLMPVIALLFKCHSAAIRRGTLFTLTVASALFSQYIVPGFHNGRIEWSLAGHLEFFLAGVLLADVYLNPPVWLRPGPLGADICAAFSAALVVYVLHWQPTMAWVEPLLIIAFYYGVFHEGWAGKLFRSPWLTIPGTMCYTIYLYHQFVAEQWIRVTAHLIPPTNSLLLDVSLQMLASLPVVLSVSAVLYLLIERPFVVLSHTATRRWRPARHPAAPEAVA